MSTVVDTVRLTAEDAIALVRAVLDDAELRHDLLTRQRIRRASYGASDMAASWTALYRSLIVPATSGVGASLAAADHATGAVSWI